MRKRSKILAVLLAGVVACSMAACGNSAAPATSASSQEASTEDAAEEEASEETEAEEGTEAEDEGGETASEGGSGTAVFATSTFGQKFSPFFATTAYDMDVVNVTQLAFSGYDRGGAMIQEGMEGEVREYNGTDYTYNTPGNIEVVQNEDGSVDYNLTMRDDIVFSDGTPANIDDVIFGVYVVCDPTYDGSTTLSAMSIEGMEEYRSGMEAVQDLILTAGPDGYEETEYFTEEQYTAYWDAFNAAGEKFAQEIVDYCVANEISTEEEGVAGAAANWGFDGLAEDATAADFFDALVDEYGYDISDDGLNYESAGTAIADLIAEELGDSISDYQKGVQTGDGAENIAGIERTGDYSMTIHMTQYDANAIYQMALPIAPLHYYGDKDAYDYENNQFGFPKGDLSKQKSLNTEPLGAGPYTFEGYSNGVVTLKANEKYFDGAPKVAEFLYQESVDSDYVPGIVTGSFDVATPSMNEDTVKAIEDANGGELVGDVITTYLVDYRGYGYLGINADLVNTGDPASDESKALRKGFMTLFAVHRDTVIDSYYGDRASVIQYPISNTSWAAPQPADEGYQAAYSTDVDGNQIYTDSMTEEERYEAAKEAAIGYFQAAGFTYDEASGKFTDVSDTYEVMIPGQGTQDHPAYGVVVAASEMLEEMGITLQVNDVQTGVWNNALEGNTAMMWAAAWQATPDPDMTQVYHSDNAHGNGTNSNHYSVDDADLDELIVEGRSSADLEYRKSVYKEAMEIIMDWGCELPLYQRKDCYTVSTERINNETMPKDMTPFWGWDAEINLIETN